MTAHPSHLQVIGVRPPLQARSREMFNRVLDVGAELVAEQGYDGFSITELCRRADVSPGSLYARVSGKDALILAIHDRELSRLSAELTSNSEERDWSALTTPELIDQAVRDLGAHFGGHSALLRAFILRAAVDETMRQHGSRFATALSSGFADRVLTRTAEIPHPDPSLAVDVTYRLVHASLSWSIAFGESFDSTRSIGWDEYVAQIAAAARTYLLTPPATGRRAPDRNA